MNVYEKYRKQRVIMLKALLSAVAKETRHVMKKIPKKYLLEFLEKSNGNCVFFEWDTYEEGQLEVYFKIWFNGNKMIDKSFFLDYDNSVVKGLEEFVKMHYPDFYVERGFTLNLEDMTASFGFGFDLEYDDEDCESYRSIQSETIEASLKLFNDDLAELLQHEYTTGNWKELLVCHDDCEDAEKIDYCHGYTEVNISIK